MIHRITLYIGCDGGTRDAWDCDCGHGGSGPAGAARYDVETHAEGHVGPDEQVRITTGEPRT